LSVSLAEHFKTVVFSADSRQFYKEMSIGTAKPTLEEMKGVKHYFIDSHSIHNEISAAKYVELATPLLLAEFEKHNTIILTGGSGMFIDALCFGLDETPHSIELRDELTEFVKQHGTAELLNEIQLKDPDFYETLDKNNPVRIIRAVEVMRLSGKKFSELRKNTIKKQPFIIHYFIIEHDRSILYDRINQRVEIMLNEGLEEEVKSLVPFKNLSSMRTVGYSEFFDYFDGKHSKDETIELIKQNSRRYAKRQLTWFRRHKEAVWIPFASNENMQQNIIDCVLER